MIKTVGNSTNAYEFGKMFADYMLSVIPTARLASGGREILCRCKYCEDSRNPTHAHMYIKIPQSEDDPVLFNCVKCHTSGLVTSKRLMEWGVYDSNIAEGLSVLVKNAGKKGKLGGYDRYIYPNLDCSRFNLELGQTKLDYINNRLGLNLGFKDYIDQKIVFNIKDTLIVNRLTKYTRHENIMDQLNQYFFGFISADNNFVNLRRICDEGIVYHTIDKRYINYNIHNKKDNTEKFYIMPTMVYLDAPERINVHIAEGPFDILSIRYNLRGINSPDIFMAICGSGYKGALMYLMDKLKLFYFNLHIYPDNDNMGTDDMIDRDIITTIRPLVGTKIFVHRNTKPGEKDFGVPINRIQESVRLIQL